MMYALKLIEVPEGTPTTLIGKVLKLKSLPATVGRGQDASLVIQHRKLSRLHCRFYLSDESLHVRDLGSTNGTAVNGVLAMGAQALQVGDHVSLGGVVFQVGQWMDANTGSERVARPAAGERSPASVPAAAGMAAHEATSPRQVVMSSAVTDETVDWMVDAPGADAPSADTSRLTPVPNPIPPTPPSANPTPQPPIQVSAVKPAEMAADDSAIQLEGLPRVEPVSHVQIEASFVAKAGTSDPSLLPQFRPAHLTEVDPDALDLSEIAEVKKDASVSALGNFFSQRNIKRS